MIERVSFDLNQFLVAISFALDFVEIDLLGATQNHSRRVAYAAIRMAEELNLPSNTKADLISYSILHDNGLCEEALATKIKYKQFNQIQRMEGFKEHCQIGEDNIVDYPFLTANKNIILYHHEFYNGKGFHNIKGNDIPLLAQLVGIADFTDNLHHLESNNRDKIEKFFLDNSSKYFDADLVDLILSISKHNKFWLDLKDQFINYALMDHYIPNTQSLTWKEIYNITKVFSKIIDSKSRFTGRHSRGLIEKADLAADLYDFDQNLRYKFMIAASLHDLGKLAIPGAILDKRGRLTKEEIRIVQSHTYYTKFALSKIDNFNEIKEWAGNHHEKLNGNGYPEGIAVAKLDFNSRLMAVLDIFQALVENRPYREGLDYPTIKKIMMKMVKENSLDGEITIHLLPWLKEKLGLQ